MNTPGRLARTAPPSKKVPICTACYIKTSEHAEELAKIRSKPVNQRTESDLDLVRWSPDAPTEICAFCKCETESGLMVAPPPEEKDANE